VNDEQVDDCYLQSAASWSEVVSESATAVRRDNRWYTCPTNFPSESEYRRCHSTENVVIRRRSTSLSV